MLTLTLLKAFTPFWVSMLFTRPPLVSNVNVVTNITVAPIVLDSTPFTGVIVIQTSRAINVYPNGRVILGEPVTTTLQPPLITSYTQTNADHTADSVITLVGIPFFPNSGVTIGPLVVSSGDITVAAPSDTTATINYYANQIGSAGVYNLFWTNPDGGVGVVQITFT